MDLYPQTGVLLTPERLKKTEEFLNKMGLRYEGGADYTVQLLSEYGEIVGTGSLCGNVLKYIAIDERLRGEGAALTLVSELVSEAYRRGITKLFLFTKAENEMLFKGVGFYTVAATRDVCFMENTRTGFGSWLASLERHDGVIGAAVMNCNPFTRGHRYLVEEAAKQVDHLDVFVVSEDKSRFAFEDRMEMVRLGTKDIPNVTVQPSGDYMISHATFPTYFMKEGVDTEKVNASLDLIIFAEKIAPALNITKRFVGTEPYCPVTNKYNELMKELLPPRGIEVVETERLLGISASSVRAAMDARDFETVLKLVPDTTFEIIRERYM